jgi:hypothetical protein
MSTDHDYIEPDPNDDRHRYSAMTAMQIAQTAIGKASQSSLFAVRCGNTPPYSWRAPSSGKIYHADLQLTDPKTGFTTFYLKGKPMYRIGFKKPPKVQD